MAGVRLGQDLGGTITWKFLLPRERLLEIIQAAGRTPQVAGDGEMSTFDATNGVTYPQLFVVEAGADYTRFDHFHVNATADGPGIDEVMQIPCGGGIRVLQHLPARVSSPLSSTASGASAAGPSPRTVAGRTSAVSPGPWRAPRSSCRPSARPRWEVQYVDA